MHEARQADPDNPRVILVLAQAQAAAGDVTAAEETLDGLPADEQDKPEVTTLRSQLFFEGQLAGAPAATELEARLAADPGDHEALFQLALRKVVDQEYDAAMDLLLQLMQENRKFGDDAGRRVLLKIFEVLGDDPLVSRYRSRMANLLY